MKDGMTDNMPVDTLKVYKVKWNEWKFITEKMFWVQKNKEIKKIEWNTELN